MFAFIERRYTQMQEVRRQRRVERAARAAVEENMRSARIRFCPNCQVPIEKNDGCDHMHCAFCGAHFSWRAAIPCNVEAFENTGDGRFRFCPHCQYQNRKLHCLVEARCMRCQRDFKWEEALFVPVTQLRVLPSAPPQEQIQNPPPAPPPQRPQRPRRRQRGRAVNDCGAARQAPPQVTPALRRWLDDPRRVKMISEIPFSAGEPEVVPVSPSPLHEALRCEICAERPKSFALPCGHLFCEHCLVTYLRDHPICPVDRSVVQVPPIKIYF